MDFCAGSDTARLGSRGGFMKVHDFWLDGESRQVNPKFYHASFRMGLPRYVAGNTTRLIVIPLIICF